MRQPASLTGFGKGKATRTESRARATRKAAGSLVVASQNMAVLADATGAGGM